MKSIIFFLALLTSVVILSCSTESPHRELTNWIDAGNLKFGPNQIIKDDSIIINLLQMHNYLDTSHMENNQLVTIQQKLRPIDMDSAIMYYRIYMNRLDSMKEDLSVLHLDTFKAHLDLTEAVILDFDNIYTAMQTHLQDLLNDSTRHDEAGFVVYPANYGQPGKITGSLVQDTFQSTYLVQLVRKDPEVNNQWNVVADGEVWNFGGLKPPNIIKGKVVKR